MSKVKFSISMNLIINEEMKNTIFVILKDFNKENGILETDNFDNIITGYFSRDKYYDEDEVNFYGKYSIIHQKEHNFDNIKFDNTFFEYENYKDTIEKLFILICSYLDIESKINVKINNKKYRDYIVDRDKYLIRYHTDKYKARISKTTNQINYIDEYVEDIFYDVYNNKEISHYLFICKVAEEEHNKIYEDRAIYIHLPLAQTFINLIEKGFNPISEMSSYYHFKDFDSNNGVTIYIGTNDKYSDIKEIEKIFINIIKDTNFVIFDISGKKGTSFICLNCKREYFRDVDLDIINFRIKNLN